MAQAETLAAVTFLQDRCHRVVVLHPVLHIVLCPNAAADQRYSKGCIMDHPLRPGKDLSIRRPDHPRRRGLQTPQEQTQAQKILTPKSLSSSNPSIREIKLSVEFYYVLQRQSFFHH